MSKPAQAPSKALIVTPQQFALEQKWAQDNKLTPYNSSDPSLYPIAMSQPPSPEEANPLRPLIRPQVRERWTARAALTACWVALATTPTWWLMPATRWRRPSAVASI